MIQVSHLTKYYGDFLAVDDLSFEFQDGRVYGFLGPNGAGKSTTMNIITGCLSPSDGTVRIGDYDILEQPVQAKRLIGYLPEQPPLYPNETPLEYLQFVGEAKGLRGSELWNEIDSAVQSTGITDVQDRLIGTLSKGYRQRVGIAQALLGKPQVIILDEPTVGLDPIQIVEIRDLIRELGGSHTVILSSHILSEVQAVCEQVLIISKGRLTAFDTPENLERLLASNSVGFRVEADRSEAEGILSAAKELTDWEISESDGVCSITANLAGGQDTKDVCGRLTLAFAAKGLPVFEMHARKANLEDVFLELTESGAAEKKPGAEESDGTQTVPAEGENDSEQEPQAEAESPAETEKKTEGEKEEK